MKKIEVNPDDPYTYKDTTVLVNKRDITNRDDLRNIEGALSEAKLIEIKSMDFSSNGFKDLHKNIFGELYDWAGKTRNVNLSGVNVSFAPMRFLEQGLTDQFNKISMDIKNKNNISNDDWVKKAANHFGELLFIHPFRDGNGRATRKFVNLFLQEKGLYLNWDKMDKDEYYRASELAINKADNSLLEKIFRDNLEYFF